MQGLFAIRIFGRVTAIPHRASSAGISAGGPAHFLIAAHNEHNECYDHRKHEAYYDCTEIL